MIGQTIAHYEILEKLGGGGMGVVYKARDRKLGRFVALKFLLPGMVETPAAKERFAAEARAASALDHPNIGTIHAIEETPTGDLFIVMAYYEGETVALRIGLGPLPAHQAVDLAAQAADGLARAHERGIIHRDIKPANLLVTREGRVKIVDFGLAKMADVRLTDPGITLGTPAYMSPEQATGSAVDHRTDVWSLGVVLYEMLTGHLPFRGEVRQDVVDAILRSTPEPMRLPAGTPHELEVIVRRALAKGRTERFQSMVELLQELRTVHRTLGGLSAEDTLDRIDAPSPVAGPRTPRPPSTPSPHPSGERRQLTVLACELVDFLAASERLDPEELQGLLRTYDEICSAIVGNLDGYLAKAQEGRVLVYFGYPIAHEDDGRRAVLAGRQIAAAMRDARARVAPKAGELLSVRAGVHTGMMVIGEARRGSSEPAALVGNVAAITVRLLEGTSPDSVVVSADARRLIEGFFDLEALDERSLPGLSRPIAVYRVLQDSGAGSRADAAIRAGLTPLVDREQELALVLSRWEQAKEETGQVVLLAGEPGIGKSRLVQEVRERLRGEPHVWLQFRCLPYHANDALHPVTETLGHVAGFAEEDSPARKLSRLEEALKPYATSPEVVALLAAALSLPLPEGHSDLPLAPQKQKQKTLEALLRVLLALAARQPVLFAIEDLHWVDPSTQELLDLLMRECATAAILVLATARPGFVAGGANEEHVTRLVLNRLSRRQTESLAAQVAGDASLAPGLLQQIVNRTDGVPLFVEELTKALCESTPAPANAEGAAHGAQVPVTLQESLGARLDRLGSAKTVAQIGATVGREFSYRLLETISAIDPQTLRFELARLVASGLLHRRGSPPAATYLFKHALVQEVAYQSLLKSTRQQYHERIAQALEDDSPETATGEPHLLAYHYSEAGLPAPAIRWWSHAARRATERFANREAVSDLRRALSLLDQLPASPARDAHELGLQMSLCAILPSVSGYAAPETEQAYFRAQELCDRAEPAPEHFWIIHGLWAFHFVRGRLDQARERAQGLFARAQQQPDTLSRLDGHYALGVTLAFLGELASARDHLERGIDIDDADPGRTPSYLSGMELGVTTPSYSVMVLWLLGYADQALDRSRRTVDRARRLGHPLTLAFALYYLAWVHLHRGEAESARATARDLIALSEEHGLFFGPLGGTLLGWSLDQSAPVVPAWCAREPSGSASPSEDGIAPVVQGLAFYRATGSRVNTTHMLSLLAVGHARRGRIAESRQTVEEALAFALETGESWWTAELHRLAGEITLASAKPGTIETARSQAEAAFHQALDIASAQGALALELRAALSLARLRGAQGRERLARAYGRFTEGHETGDLRAARELLGA